jgi:hypothetical protein
MIRPRVGFDLDGDGHAGREVDRLVGIVSRKDRREDLEKRTGGPVGMIMRLPSTLCPRPRLPNYQCPRGSTRKGFGKRAVSQRSPDPKSKQGRGEVQYCLAPHDSRATDRRANSSSP